jgi:hypothetical protein
MNRGIPPQVVTVAERCSQFSRQPGFSIDRVIYSYRTVRCPDGIWHVLTSIRDAGADYSGRTNHLAQHLVLSASEASELARQGNTPACVMLGTVCSWGDHTGFCGWLEETPHAVSSELDSSWLFWNAYTGSGYCRLNLCSDAALRGAVLVYGRGLQPQPPDAKQVLCLFAESQAGCPDKGWGTTFTTSLEPNDELSDFRWIGVAEDSSMLAKLEAAGGRVKITFETPPPAARQPNLAALAASPNNPTSVHDAASIESDAFASPPEPAASGTAVQPPRIPPKRPTPSQAKKSFLSAHRSALAVGGVVALVALVAIGMLLKSLLSDEPHSFLGTLTVEYDGKPKSVALSDGRPVFYRQSLKSPNGWSSQPPVDAGRYEVGVETSHWLGLQKRVSPTGKALTIDQKRPVISFPEDLAFVTSKGSTKTWPIEPTIYPPEAGAGRVVEYRRLRPQASDWEEQPRVLTGEYEVRVSTRETRNFAAATGVTNFSISAPEPPTQATGPAITPPAPTAGSDESVTLPQNASSAAYYLALGSEALKVAQENVNWRDNPSPSKVEVLQWLDGSQNYRELDEKGNFREGLTKDFSLTGGGLPEQRLSTSQIQTDAVVYRAFYQNDPKEVYLIGLRSEGDNLGAVDDLLGGAVWLSKAPSGLRLVSQSKFFSTAKLLPLKSKWILRITTGPYSDGDELVLSSQSPEVFSLEDELKRLAQISDQCDVLIKKAKEEKSAPPLGNNYLTQNAAKLLGPLQELASEESAAQSIAAQFVKAIMEIRPPATGQDGSAPDNVAAARLFGGALDCAFDNPEINPRIQLTERASKDAKDETDDARKKDGGLDWSKIRSPKLLSPDEFETWLLEPREKPRSVADIKAKSKEWLSYRIGLLELFDKKEKTDSSGAKKALEALRAGIDKCDGQTIKASPAVPTINVEQEERKLVQATRKQEFLNRLGTAAAAGETAQLQIQFVASEPGQSTQKVTLLPVVRLGPQLSQQP